MNNQTFVVELVKAIGAFAWPCALLIIVLIFRRPLCELLLSLTALEGKGFRAEFGKSLSQIEKALEKRSPEEPSTVLQGQTIDSPFLKLEYYKSLVKVSVRTAIIDAWDQVVKAMIDCSKTHGLDLDGENFSVSKALHLLMGIGVIRSTDVGVYSELWLLREKAARMPDFSLSEDDALKYCDLAIRTAKTLIEQSTKIQDARGKFQ